METKRIKVIDEDNILVEDKIQSKDMTIDGWPFPPMGGCKDSKYTWGCANFPLSNRTVYVYGYDFRPFFNSYRNLELMFNRIFDANPHLKFKFETVDDYRGKIEWWYNRPINGFSYRKIASEITYDLETDCHMSFGVYWNPYYELCLEEVCGVENKLRAEAGLEPIEKFRKYEEEY